MSYEGGAGVTAPVMGGAGTTSVASITSSSAALTGTYTSDGGSPITATGFVVYPSGNPSTIIGGANVLQFPDGTLPSPINASATGLTSNTNYCFKPYATNSVGTSYGVELCFTTLTPPIPRFISANTSGQSITIINANTNAVISTIALGVSIRGISYGNGKLAISTGGGLSFYDSTTYSLLSTVAGISLSEGLIFGGGLFAVYDGNFVKFFDSSSMLLTGSIDLGGVGQQLNFYNGHFYAVKLFGNTVYKLDPVSFSIVRSAATGANPRGVSAGDGKVFVANSSSGSSNGTIYDETTGALLNTTTWLNQPNTSQFINNEFFYAGNQVGSVDSSTFSVSAPIGGMTAVGNYSTVGNGKFAAVGTSTNTISFFDPISNTHLGNTTVGANPGGITFIP